MNRETQASHNPNILEKIKPKIRMVVPVLLIIVGTAILSSPAEANGNNPNGKLFPPKPPPPPPTAELREAFRAILDVECNFGILESCAMKELPDDDLDPLIFKHRLQISKSLFFKIFHGLEPGE